MSKAKYYVYRNLHTGGFSIKYKGKVIARPEKFVLHNVEFRVSEAGRRRVIEQGRRNVHAFAVCDSWEERKHIPKKLVEVSYNPYYSNEFFVKVDVEDISLKKWPIPDGPHTLYGEAKKGKMWMKHWVADTSKNNRENI